jgi:hypothetical protein
VVEADKGVLRPENTVVVAVEEVAVLLQDSLVRVLLCPVVLYAALWPDMSTIKLIKLV